MDLHFWVKNLGCHSGIIVGLFYMVTAFAQSADQEQIQKVMVAEWQRPDAVLKVEPIVVVGNDAIAGWSQGQRGGRALLRRQDGVWQVYVCGGDGLKNASALQQAGINSHSAQLLAQELALAEMYLSSSQLKQFSTFEGIVPVSSNHNVRHSQHHK